MSSKTLSAVAFAFAIISVVPAGADPQQDAGQGVDKNDIAGTPAPPSGLSASDWSNINDSIDAHRHAFEATHGGFEASNPRFDWVAQFDGTSALIRPADGDWSFGFALEAFGFEGHLSQVESPAFGACAEGQEITYGWTPELSEWWINDRRGFEHGFTVHERPAPSAEGNTLPLVFQVETLGSLRPKVNESRTGLSLLDGAGVSVLRYDGLVAFDANGVGLPAWLEVQGRKVRICVDDAFAEYPVTVDPVVQEAYIKASNTDADDSFGAVVAASGDTVIVGAPGEDSSAAGSPSNNAASNSGAAYIFVRSGSSWTQQAYLKAPQSVDDGDTFGSSVAISGDTVVVGAPFEDSGSTGVNGSPFDNSAIDSGAAYIFVRTGSSWAQQAYLKASNTNAADQFGWAVAVSDGTAVIGARREDSNATGVNGDQSNNSNFNSGAAYVFVRSGSSWTQQAYLKSSNSDTGDAFGYAVAASGDTVAVGARVEDSNATGVNGLELNNSAPGSGAAYVFVRSGSSWTQQAYLKASNTDDSDFFGFSVAASGDTVVVGASNEASNATGVNGMQSDNSVSGAGAAYVFVRSGTSWAQQAYLKASNTGGGDTFGESVTVSGDAIVVGAHKEDSSSTGINGSQVSNSTNSAGAAYFFVRSGSSWAQQGYLKASNSGSADNFGRSVAASGTTFVVGARGESSNATGINGNQSDNSTPGAGAVYTFDLSGFIGMPYCGAVINSTGVAGELRGSGSTLASDNNLALLATNLPANAFGFFVTSMIQGFAMNPGGSTGNICLGGPVGRYVGPGQIQQANASGSFSLQLDLTNTPQPNGLVSVNAGETWNFQAWYRDVGGTGATSNFTNGLMVTFDQAVSASFDVFIGGTTTLLAPGVPIDGPVTLDFVNTSMGADTFEWAVRDTSTTGNLATATTQDFGFDFVAMGTYEVTLTSSVSGSMTNSDTVVRTIVITEPIVASFMVDPASSTEIGSGGTVRVIDSSTGTIDTRVWTAQSIDDSSNVISFATGPNATTPVLTFPSAGRYRISLAASGPNDSESFTLMAPVILVGPTFNDLWMNGTGVFMSCLDCHGNSQVANAPLFGNSVGGNPSESEFFSALTNTAMNSTLDPCLGGQAPRRVVPGDLAQSSLYLLVDENSTFFDVASCSPAVVLLSSMQAGDEVAIGDWILGGAKQN